MVALLDVEAGVRTGGPKGDCITQVPLSTSQAAITEPRGHGTYWLDAVNCLGCSVQGCLQRKGMRHHTVHASDNFQK